MEERVKHPAKFSDNFLPLFNELLSGSTRILDPMAGTGKLGLIKNYGFEGTVVCNEIEPEWTDDPEMLVDEWYVGDAANMDWAEDDSFDAICTSPTYGNRMADHFKIKSYEKKWKYITYTHFLGRPLNEDNTGRMSWGKKYRDKHVEIYKECVRVLKPKGLMIVNVSDHIRKGAQVMVTDWHKETLLGLGLTLKEDIKVETPRMRFGQNNKLRVTHEHILVFTK